MVVSRSINKINLSLPFQASRIACRLEEAGERCYTALACVALQDAHAAEGCGAFLPLLPPAEC